jgi:hypothetical protein
MRGVEVPPGTAGFRAKSTPKSKKWFVVAVDAKGRDLWRVFPTNSTTPSRLRYTDRNFVEWIVWAMNESFRRGRESTWRHPLQESELPR